MNTKLNYDQDWSALARRANWSVAGLAALSGVTERTLRRYFLKHMGQKPKEWLTKHRQTIAVKLLRDGTSVKETASELGYEHAETFSREFKKQCGQYPAEISQNLTPKAVASANVRKSHEMSDLVGSIPLESGKSMI